MSRYQPPFSITPAILNLVIEVGELLGHWAATSGYSSPLLRKENRIRTIQASLAIEHNSLSTEQVTAIMEGKRVLAPAKDIQEVRNAILAYEALSGWKSDCLDHLLEAHSLLMRGLVDNPGTLRRGDVGIYRGSQIVHMAPPASQVSRLIVDLLAWRKETELHPLVASSIFHYEFEFIHPFPDGNGRMGRLWQTLILSEWRAELAWLPVETLIHHQQESYYQVLGACDRVSDCTAFVEFILKNIVAALQEDIQSRIGFNDLSEEMSGKMSGENTFYLTKTETQIRQLLQQNARLTASEMGTALTMSARTVERHLKKLQEKNVIRRVGATKNGYWQIL